MHKSRAPPEQVPLPVPRFPPPERVSLGIDMDSGSPDARAAGARCEQSSAASFIQVPAFSAAVHMNSSHSCECVEIVATTTRPRPRRDRSVQQTCVMFASADAAAGTSSQPHDHIGGHVSSRCRSALIHVLESIERCRRPALPRLYRGRIQASCASYPWPIGTAACCSICIIMNREFPIALGRVEKVGVYRSARTSTIAFDVRLDPRQKSVP